MAWDGEWCVCMCAQRERGCANTSLAPIKYVIQSKWCTHFENGLVLHVFQNTNTQIPFQRRNVLLCKANDEEKIRSTFMEGGGRERES